MDWLQFFNKIIFFQKNVISHQALSAFSCHLVTRPIGFKMADNLMFWLVILSLTAFCPFVVALFYYQHWRKEDNKEFHGKNVLFVTAHPDDECMFFAPSIVRLARCAQVFLLCICTGKDKRRKKNRWIPWKYYACINVMPEGAGVGMTFLKKVKTPYHWRHSFSQMESKFPTIGQL